MHLWEIVLTLAACLLALLLLASAALLCVALLRVKTKDPLTPENLARWGENCEIIRSGMEWLHAQPMERVELRSFDGLRLVALYLPAETPRCTTILMHGYRSEHLVDFSVAYRLLHENGCDLLIPYQRAHGESQGRLITMGVKEKRDCADWARYAAERFGPDRPIILEGMSMGAATVLMAAGEPLPENVRGIVADCGYTSPWEEFAHVMRRSFRLPAWPLLHLCSLLSRVVGGFGFRDCSTLDTLSRSKLPLLLIHGESDDFVPARFSRAAYAASASTDKELILVPNAAHCGSFLVDQALCTEKLLAFYARCTAKDPSA